MEPLAAVHYNRHISSSDTVNIKLGETNCSDLSSNSICNCERCVLMVSPENLEKSGQIDRLASSSSHRTVSDALIASDPQTVKRRSLCYTDIQHQQRMNEAGQSAWPPRMALWHEARCHATTGLQTTWWPPLSPMPLQFSAVYRSPYWTRLVSSLFGADLARASAFASARAASTVTRSVHSAGRLPPPTATDHRSVDHPATNETLPVVSDVRPPRSNLVNWLLDSSSSWSTTSSAVSATTTTAEISRQPTTGPALDIARRLLEQTLFRIQFYRKSAEVHGDVDGINQQVRDGCSGSRIMAPGSVVDPAANGFSCRLCCKRYATPGAMKMHSRTHTLPCRCAVCGKAFSRPWLLQGHLRTHTGERPFACSQCQRAFADRSNLRAHLQTHAVVKKYACSRCTKTFSRMSLLVKHEDGTACPGRVSAF